MPDEGLRYGFPGWLQEHLQRARDLYTKGEFNATIIELKHAMRQKPDLAEARWLLDKAYLDLGKRRSGGG